MTDVYAKSTLEAATKSVAQTFEGVAFSQVLEDELLEASPQLNNTWHGAYIDIPEPLGLRFLLVMQQDHVRETFETVAGSMGVVDAPDQVLEDFHKELTNTAAGHLYTLLSEDSSDMTIGIPKMPTSVQLTASLEPGPQRAVTRLQIEHFTTYVVLEPVSHTQS